MPRPDEIDHRGVVDSGVDLHLNCSFATLGESAARLPALGRRHDTVLPRHAAARELERDMQDDAGVGHPQRVADGDRATVDVDHRGSEPQFPGGGDTDGGERLVDFDQVQFGRRETAAERAALMASAGWDCKVESGLATKPWPVISASQRSPRRSATALFITTTAQAPSDSCEALPAVTVPE